MARFKVYLEYEGTRYSGWQIQENARTIQGCLYKAANEIFLHEKVEIQGSGRTDSGVHAICQVAHLDVNTMLAPEIIRMKFNDKLPHDINILEIEKVTKNFHARHDVTNRSYIYQIAKRRTAFGKSFVWWIKDNLDFKRMEGAAKIFIGMHDFISFSEKDKNEKSTKVLINDIQLVETGDLIIFRIIGSHFLWKMVRRIVGVLVEIGRGDLTTKDIIYFLERYSSVPAQYTAPPSGLFLEQIKYDNTPIDKEFKNIVNIISFERRVKTK